MSPPELRISLVTHAYRKLTNIGGVCNSTGARQAPVTQKLMTIAIMIGVATPLSRRESRLAKLNSVLPRRLILNRLLWRRALRPLRGIDGACTADWVD